MKQHRNKTPNKIYIYGKHALIEALENRPQSIKKVFLSPNIDDQTLLNLVRKTGVPRAALGADKSLSNLEGNAVHQGVIGLLSVPDLVVDFKEFLKGLKVTDDTALVLLGEVQDPHNVGAVIRSAAAFGISGVLIPEHNQAPVTGSVIKVSAGMAFRVPIVSIGNVNQTVRELKDAGFTVYGLDGGGTTSLEKETFNSPSVFILGNEANGIRHKTREYCDQMLSIDMHPRCESLNAAASTSIVLYAWSNKHPDALK